MAIRCFCPPLMCVPCCPTNVSYFCNHCKRQYRVDMGRGGGRDLHINIKWMKDMFHKIEVRWNGGTDWSTGKFAAVSSPCDSQRYFALYSVADVFD